MKIHNISNHFLSFFTMMYDLFLVSYFTQNSRFFFLLFYDIFYHFLLFYTMKKKLTFFTISYTLCTFLYHFIPILTVFNQKIFYFFMKFTSTYNHFVTFHNLKKKLPVLHFSNYFLPFYTISENHILKDFTQDLKILRNC